MYKRYTKIISKYNRVYRASWIILSSLIVMIIFHGCVGMRSVRNAKGSYLTKSQDKSQSSQNGFTQSEAVYSNMMDEFEKKFYKPEDDSKPTEETTIQNVLYMQQADNEQLSEQSRVEKPKNKIPTLSEQMKSISSGQREITNQVGNLQHDVDEMKETLDDIKVVLYDLAGKKVLPSTGATVKQNVKKINEVNKSSSNNIILPDEKIEKKKPTSKSTVKSPKRKTNSTKSKNHKAFTMKPISYSTNNKSVAVLMNDKRQISEEKDENNLDSKEKYNIAFTHFKNRRYNEAIVLFSDLTKSELNSKILSDSYYWLGESYFGTEQYGMAMKYFKKVSTSGNSTKNDNAQAMYAECLIRSGQINDAKKAFKDLIAKYPDSSFVSRARKMLQQL